MADIDPTPTAGHGATRLVAPWGGARPRIRAALLIAGALLLVAASLAVFAVLSDGWAPMLAALGVAAGAGVMVFAARRERGRRLAAALIPDGERDADHAWELSEIAEHYRRTADGRRRAEAASDAKSRFLATVSHELRTPLSGMLGLTDLLMETPLAPAQETFARAVRVSGELMLGLIDDMLDFAKIEAGRFDLNPQSTDLAGLAEDVVELFASRSEAKGIDLGTLVTPAAGGPAIADGPRLRQVLINLIANAVKFTEHGGVALHIGPDPADRALLRFAVEDSGPGVAAEAVESIFAEFNPPLPEARPRYAGSGLGLSISRRIVRRMGGDITVSARPGGGSVFAFSIALPLVGAPGRAAAIAGRRALILAPAGLAPGLIAQALAEDGAAARITDSAHQAASLAGAAIAAGEPYDLLFIDPRATPDPAAALGLIREAAGRPIPAAILIPPGRRQEPAAMSAAGFNAYLVRPVRRASLLRIAELMLTGGGGFGMDPRDRNPAAAPNRAAGGGSRILLAEDDEINALLLRSLVQRFGHEVTEVADGDAAIAAAAAGRHEAAILDLHLPGSDGIAVATVIRDRERRDGKARTLLVAISADLRPEIREAALDAGFDIFLPKPVGADALRHALAKAGNAVAAA